MSWHWASICDLCYTFAGYGFPIDMQGKRTGDLPFFKVGDISDAWQCNRTWLTDANHYLTNDEADSINAKPLPQDTTVFAKIGAAIALNRRAMLSEPSLVDNNVMGLHPFPGVLHPKFLFYFMWTIRLGDASRATTVPSVRKSDVENIPFPLPPLPEQHRIVAEIEKQFTRLDASVAALKRAQANLKRYRASVLKAACEGKLIPTEAELAQAEGRDYEPASVLLERILTERRASWESQEKRRGKYKEPVAPDISDLPELPAGWVWATVGQLILGTPQNGIYKPKAEYGQGVPILRIDDFQDFYLKDREFLQCLNVTAEESDTYGLKPNQLIINRVNSPSHLGKCLIVPNSLLPAVFESNMMKITADHLVDPFLVAYYLRSPEGRNRLTSNAKWAVNQASINQKDVSMTPIPLPPLAEQRRIVAEIERRLSVIQQTEVTVEASLKRAERLRQSVLKRAFSGQLVPQDPDDEPASALLERIRAGREAAQAAAPTKRKPRRRRAKSAPEGKIALPEGAG